MHIYNLITYMHFCHSLLNSWACHNFMIIGTAIVFVSIISRTYLERIVLFFLSKSVNGQNLTVRQGAEAVHLLDLICFLFLQSSST